MLVEAVKVSVFVHVPTEEAVPILSVSDTMLKVPPLLLVKVPLTVKLPPAVSVPLVCPKVKFV